MAGEDPPRVAEYRRAGAVPRLREEARTFFRLSPAGDSASRTTIGFAVRRGDCRTRLNPSFFAGGFQALLTALNAVQSIRPLGELIADGGFGVLPPSDSYLADGGVRFLRPTEMREGNQIDWATCLRAPAEFGRHKRARVLVGDIILAVKGATIAAEKSVCLINELSEPTIVNGSIFRFQPNRAKVSGEFLLEVLSSSIARRQMKGAMILNNAVDYLSRDVIDQLLLPIPSPSEQTKLVRTMAAARAARRRKLTEAESLLGGLDAFVLEAIGLTLPSPDGSGVYAVRSTEVTPTRLDVGFYRPFLRKTETAIRGLSCGLDRLGSLLREPPLNGLDAREFSASGQRYLRVQNVRPFDLSFDDVKYVGVDTKKDIALAAGDVLLTRKGTFGVAAVVPQTATDCLISSEVMLLRLRARDSVSADFLVAWLNSTACQTLLSRHKTGAIMGHLTQHVVEDLPIPILDSASQKRIAAEVASRREAARSLREEAARVWEDAKQKFEMQLLEPGNGEAAKVGRR